MKRVLQFVAVAAAAALGTGLALSWWYRSSAQDITIVVVDPPAEAVPTPAEGLPNVVVIIGCTVRKDQVSIHGGLPDLTPWLSSLAEQGAVFDDVIAAGPWTRVASTALLTGHHPLSIGMVEPGPRRNDRALPASVTTLAEHLRSMGYRTLGYTGNPNLNAVFGFEQGFDQYLQLEYLWREKLVRVDGEWAVHRVLQMLDDQPEEPQRPVYLQMMFVDTHAPYTIEPEEADAYRLDDLPEEVAGYRAALHELDAIMGRLDRGLQERGLTPDNTIFAFVTDHGEGLSYPEHHGKSHGRYLASSTVAGIWAVRGPGVAEGKRIGGVASQVDVLPTLLGMLGANASYDGMGYDFSDQLRGRAHTTERPAAYTDTWFLQSNRAAMYTDEWACQRNFDATEFRRGSFDRFFREGCFRRAADPMHERPLPSSEQERQLIEWRDLRVAEFEAFEDVTPAAVPEEVVQQLEALGYWEE